jgi:hypothetical protein
VGVEGGEEETGCDLDGDDEIGCQRRGWQLARSKQDVVD